MGELIKLGFTKKAVVTTVLKGGLKLLSKHPKAAALGVGDLAEAGTHLAKAMGIKAKPHVADEWMFMGFPVVGSMTPYIDKYHKMRKC